MYFKADYDKLSEISRTSLTKCNDLNDLYADIVKIIEEVDKCWTDMPSIVYFSEMKDFLTQKSRELNALLAGSFALNKIAMIYGAQDDKWADLIKRSSIVKDTFLNGDDKHGR